MKTTRHCLFRTSSKNAKQLLDNGLDNGTKSTPEKAKTLREKKHNLFHLTHANTTEKLSVFDESPTRQNHNHISPTLSRITFTDTPHLSRQETKQIVAVMPSSALAPFMHQLQQSFNNFDLNQFADRVDLKHWVSQLDLKSVGFVAVAIISVLLILQLFAKSYIGPARSLVASAAHAWQDSRDLPYDHPARASRNLDSVTQVLDTLAEAAIKWDESNTNEVNNTAI
ncbi:hypothetical protein Pmani_017114 [Petrolisthes manimaculis]|uniref:Uncharacterized protein n=1 Tax=Petrolisthes manimaculis TaxID=1843537 RepID=A0AAE1U9S7_9EUCA|nr:hypothetical protein Pmani_017114 [Petrolisthes manimaculis]